MLSLGTGEAAAAATIGIGMSPGDAYSPQPYFYISRWPAPAANALPSIPRPGHWHTLGFVGSVASGEAVLAMPEPRARLRDFIDAAIDICRDLLPPAA